MHVSSINNFRFSRQNTVEQPNPDTQNPNFGALKFKNKALKNAVQAINNSMEISLESDNIPIAEEKLRKFMKLFMEPWDFTLFRHPKLPEKFGALPKVFGEGMYPASSTRILPENAAAYEKRLAKLGSEATDLNVEIVERSIGENGSINYVLDIPAMGIKNKNYVFNGQYIDHESSWGLPNEHEVDTLKRMVFEDILGKDLVKGCNEAELTEAFFAVARTNEKPGFDIYGNLKKLINFMQKQN